MKRNNLFMLSYIVFIFICFIVRIFCEYPMWNTLVVSISVSSGVFAFADYYSGKASSELSASKITKDLFARTEKCISDQLRIVDVKLKEQMSTEPMEQLGAECYIDEKNKLLRLKEENSAIKIMYEENNRQHKRFCNYANILNFFGYLSFFITLVFQTVSSVLSSYLDLLSVLAFGLILLTQYMTGRSEEKIEKQKIDAKKVYDTTTDFLKVQSQYLDSMINLESTIQEEKENAD